MTKIKILTISVIALAVLNLGMIAFFVAIKTNFFGHRDNSPRKIIIEKLALDQEQQIVFEKMVVLQIKKVKENEKKIIATKQNLYHLLTQPTVDKKAKDSLINELGKLQKNIENSRFNHFKAVKEICKSPEQQQKFKNLTLDLAKMFSHRRPTQLKKD